MEPENSILLIDKPYGHSSHEITTYVKKLLGAKRAGHAGTLDPQVSGVLPVALGRATKLLQFIASKRKTYVSIIKFKHILSEERVQQLFQQFTGEITQTPPRESAVRKVARKRTVYSLQFLEQSRENPRLVLFKAEVDAGTYIRTLCEDIGKKCGGARMEELRRIAVGNITEEQTVTLTKLIDAVWVWKNKNDFSGLEKMLYVPETFIDFPKVIIKESAVPSILNGAQIAVPAIASYSETLKKDEKVSLYDEKNRFIGIGKIVLSVGELKEKKHGIAIRMLRVHLSKPL